ncbi:hypothetical protein HN958_04875 [Candidatus Falkowbacteria bacterium]|nr:hypothetical protein [Candidatus Falkowbacteria bacterium]MBT7007804.1 hypothetical protein [Candidatus Falkowbacteria bacterium]
MNSLQHKDLVDEIKGGKLSLKAIREKAEQANSTQVWPEVANYLVERYAGRFVMLASLINFFSGNVYVNKVIYSVAEEGLIQEIEDGKHSLAQLKKILSLINSPKVEKAIADRVLSFCEDDFQELQKQQRYFLGAGFQSFQDCLNREIKALTRNDLIGGFQAGTYGDEQMRAVCRVVDEKELWCAAAELVCELNPSKDREALSAMTCFYDNNQHFAATVDNYLS